MAHDLNQYVQDAIRTESVIDEVKLDPNLLASVLQIFIASGNMLDQIKKHAFYGKDYDSEKLVEEFMNIVASLDQLKPSVADIKQAEVKMMPDPNEGVIAVDPRTFHALVGIATESTELMEALVLAFSGETMDNVNVLEEFGDLNWYQAIGIDALGGDFGTILDTNIEKLRARYPEKFTNESAVNRDLDKERAILEGNPLGEETSEGC